jgi:hypothetical protein
METLKPIRRPKGSIEKPSAESPSRRKFIGGLGCAAAATFVAGATGIRTEAKNRPDKTGIKMASPVHFLRTGSTVHSKVLRTARMLRLRN